MQRTRQEIATRALRMIGVTAEDEPPSADQMAAALDVLGGLWGELLAEVRPTWDIVTGTPAEGFVPLASWLAAELAAAPSEAVAAPAAVPAAVALAPPEPPRKSVAYQPEPLS